MAGTKEGAKKGAQVKKQKYGPDHFAKIGAKGGKASKGRTHTSATKKKISESKRRWNYNHTRILEEGEKEKLPKGVKPLETGDENNQPPA